MKKIVTILIALFASLFTLHAQVINVPADQPTIQPGINAAGNGDLVLVAPGTYYENIRFMGKAITVASHFINSGDTNDINNTIIDGSQARISVTVVCQQDSADLQIAFAVFRDKPGIL